jgi:hypothetical protein
LLWRLSASVLQTVAFLSRPYEYRIPVDIQVLSDHIIKVPNSIIFFVKCKTKTWWLHETYIYVSIWW